MPLTTKDMEKYRIIEYSTGLPDGLKLYRAQKKWLFFWVNFASDESISWEIKKVRAFISRYAQGQQAEKNKPETVVLTNERVLETFDANGEPACL
jgi:hypothetical protein